MPQARSGWRARFRTDRGLFALLRSLAVLVALLFVVVDDVGAQETITALAPLKLSQTTGEKPQSKVWRNDDRWWTVLPSTTVSPTGTWLWRLGADGVWVNLLRLSSSTSAKADTLRVGNVTHVLLHMGSSSAQLVSLEYQPASQTYALWSQRPSTTTVSLSSSEIATIDLDSTGRMWLATDSSTDILVYYSDPPYSSFEGPIVLAQGTKTDDISAVKAMTLPGVPSIGVLWSNQVTKRFGFRLHVDGMDPLQWLPDEMPASQSALHVGLGMADDHLSMKVASNGTLYCAVKTSYDTSSFPKISLLVRLPGGTWDDLYEIADYGTRGIVLLNEPADQVRVVWREDSHDDIVYRDSLATSINFGATHTLIKGPVNDATSTKDNWTDEQVVIAAGKGALIKRTVNTSPTSSTTSTTHAPTTTITSTSTSSTSTTTTTTLPAGGGLTTVEMRIATSSDDAEEAQSGSVNLTSSDLELTTDGSKVQTVGMRFPGLAIPRNAFISRAYVQFQVDEATSTATSLKIEGQASGNTVTFTTATNNVSARPRTSAFVDWSPANWPTVGVAGVVQQTPNLKTIVQEIVNQATWTSGHALVMIITGTGHRVAVAHDGIPAGAPLLHVEYGLPPSTTSTTR